MMRRLTPNEQLMHKIINEGRKNMNKWFERILQDYIEEQANEDRDSIQTIENKFSIEIYDGFICTVLSLLQKFLLDKGAGNIVEYVPLLKIPPSNSN
jgi:hypothetical protein